MAKLSGELIWRKEKVKRNRAGSYVGEQKIENQLKVAAKNGAGWGETKTQELPWRGIYLIWKPCTFSLFPICTEGSILNYVHFNATEQWLWSQQPASVIGLSLSNQRVPRGLLPGNRLIWQAGSGATFSNLNSAAPFLSTDMLQNRGVFFKKLWI